jgi:two-component system chemotaxis response regulator CheY
MARILLVDDALYIRNLLRRALEGAGHEIVGEAGGGREAIIEFGRLRPDVVVLDIVMPDYDGIGALRAIRQLDPFARIVMHSAFAYPEKIVDAIASGAATFVGKSPDSHVRVPEAVAQALSAAAPAAA